MYVLRHIDRKKVHFDFLVRTDEPGPYDNEIRALGSKILVCTHRPFLARYRRKLKRIFKEHGPYDVVHSHLNEFSGVVLPVAKAAGIPIRIAHVHSSIASLRLPLWRKIWSRHLGTLVRRDATRGFFNSEGPALALFGQSYKTDPRWRQIVCGIDLSHFNHPRCPEAFRKKLGIPTGTLVVANVSRFAEPKNHRFIVEIAAEVEKREPGMMLFLVGQGPLREEIINKIKAERLHAKTIILDPRPDIPELMMNAMDVFLFPSRWEGQGMVAVEAQAAGLSVVMSDIIPQEVDLVAPLIRRLPLSQPAEVWAEAVMAARSVRHDKHLALKLIQNSPFNVLNNIPILESVYAGE